MDQINEHSDSDSDAVAVMTTVVAVQVHAVSTDRWRSTETRVSRSFVGFFAYTKYC